MTTKRRNDQFRDCSVKLPLDILWLPKSAMRPVGPEHLHTDCILVVGVSRPKLAAVFLTIMLLSLFLTFHVLYDSAVYNIKAAQAVSEHRLAILTNRVPEISPDVIISSSSSLSSSTSTFSSSSSSAINSNPQSMTFSNRVHFPKTSRRLPQALIIGVRKCGTRALLEMLYLHPRIQKAGGEIHFFDRDENYMKGLEWYRKKMPHSFRGQITIEKSPSYFVSPEVPERVRAMNASIKLLLIVREPVTRAISDYTQLRSHAATATLPLAHQYPIQNQAATQQQQLNLKQHNNQQFPSSSSSSSSSSSYSHHSIIYENKISNSGYYQSVGGSGSSKSLSNFVNNDNNYINANVGGVEDEGGLVDENRNSISNNMIRGIGTGGALSTLSSSSLSLTTSSISKSFEELAIFPNGTVNDSYRPLTISMYHLHLHRWLEVFPREQLLVVNGDQLIDDPVSQLKRIENFLGIEHRINSNHFYFNETKGFYCLRYDNGDRCLRETKGRKHPYVDPIVVSKLRKFFAEHNQKFYELVGEDLGWPEE